MTTLNHSFSRPLLKLLASIAGLVLLFAGQVGAAEAGAAVSSQSPRIVGSLATVDRLFLFLCAILVWLAPVGLALLSAGSVRAKNSLDVLMKHVVGMALVFLAFYLSFPFMFGRSIDGWIGLGDWRYLLEGSPNADQWLYWLWYAGLAGLACLLPAGAMAGRTRFLGFLVATVLLAAIVFPVAGHWAWGSRGKVFGLDGDQGWLELRGFHDFAGASVVHVVGGACALAGILVVGRRNGRFASDGTPRLIVGHHLPLLALGAFSIGIGWLGCIGGAVGSPKVVLGELLIVVLLASAMGAVTATISRWVIDGGPDTAITVSGGLAGLVAISAGADVVSPLGGLAIGLVAGLIVHFGSLLLERFQLDDATHAVPTHLFAGLWGALSVALFHGEGFAANMLTTQAIGSAGLGVAAFSMGFFIYKAVDLTIGLSAKIESQNDGMDFSEHAANAYPDFVNTEQV